MKIEKSRHAGIYIATFKTEEWVILSASGATMYDALRNLYALVLSVKR